MQCRASRHHATAAEIELLTAISADVSAREFHQRYTRSKVPGCQSSFPVTVLTTGSHKGQIHSSGTTSANPSGPMGEPAELGVVVVESRVAVVGKPSHQKGVLLLWC